MKSQTSIIPATLFLAGLLLTSAEANERNIGFAQCENLAENGSCTATCIRSLGEQCLIAHVDFKAENIKANQMIWNAKFLTCKSANVDLQLKDISLASDQPDASESRGTIEAIAKSSSDTKLTRPERSQIKLSGRTPTSVSRIPFSDFLNSGESDVQVTLAIKNCGDPSDVNSCSIEGRLVAVTDPNIRCEFHDTTQPGSFLPDGVKPANTNPLAGQVGQQ